MLRGSRLPRCALAILRGQGRPGWASATCPCHHHGQPPASPPLPPTAQEGPQRQSTGDSGCRQVGGGVTSGGDSGSSAPYSSISSASSYAFASRLKVLHNGRGYSFQPTEK